MSRHGTFHWNELLTTDPEAAASFYAALTGCGIATMPIPEGVYRVMMQGDKPVGGIMGMVPGLPPGTPPHWFSYLAVDDVDAACTAAEAAGVPVLMRGSMMDGEIEFAYVDGSAEGAPYVELARIGPQMRAFYDAVRTG